MLTIMGLIMLGIPVPVFAQPDRCTPPGDQYTPIPWAQQLLEPSRSWPITIGGGQKVAVVGTGVDSVPLLAGRVVGQEEFARPEVSANDSGRADCRGTGTAVAGVVGASDVDGIGFHGVAPGVTFLSAKVIGDQYPSRPDGGQSVDAATMTAAIRWAIDNGADVIAVTEVADGPSEQLAEVVRLAVDSNIVVVASVGDLPGGDDSPAAESYPAAYDEVIGVGAIDETGLVTGFSRPMGVDLVAPGEAVVSTYPGDGFGPASGTALAAGFVAGAAALVRTYRPQLTPAEVASRLFATASPSNEATGGSRYGYGLVNPYQAVTDRMAGGAAIVLPSMVPTSRTAEQLARERADENSAALARGLAGLGAALLVVLIAVITLGPMAKRRRWRPGFSRVPAGPTPDLTPEPPVQLFDQAKPRT